MQMQCNVQFRHIRNIPELGTRGESGTKVAGDDRHGYADYALSQLTTLSQASNVETIFAVVDLSSTTTNGIGLDRHYRVLLLVLQANR